MNNLIKIIIHAVLLFGLIYLWSVNLFLAQFILAIYLLAMFFESRISAGYFLFFIVLLPFLVYSGQEKIAEHYAVSAYIFLSGSVVYVFARQSNFMREFLNIDYSQILHILTSEKICQEKSFSGKLNEIAGLLVPSGIFIFLLLSPLFNFLLINKK